MTSTRRADPQLALQAVCQTNQDKALRELEKVLHDRPSDTQALYFRALIWSAKQEWSKALADYEVASMLSPDDPSLKFNAGLVAWHGSDLVKAERYFGEARVLDPNCEGAHYYLALVYERQGRIAEALALAQKALELRPTDCSIGIPDFIVLIDRLENYSRLTG